MSELSYLASQHPLPSCVIDESKEHAVILPLSRSAENVYTDKEYCVSIEQCTEKNAPFLLDYIREQLEHAGEMEAWHIWMGSELNPRTKRCRIAITELTEGDLLELFSTDVTTYPHTQYCFIITK